MVSLNGYKTVWIPKSGYALDQGQVILQTFSAGGFNVLQACKEINNHLVLIMCCAM